MNAVRFVQFQSFGAVINLLQNGTPDDFDQILKKLSSDVVHPQIRNGRELVCRATVVVLTKGSVGGLDKFE